MLIANRCMSSIDDDGLIGKEANKDSEMHRRVWAETIAASLEYALALTVSILYCATKIPILIIIKNK